LALTKLNQTVTANYVAPAPFLEILAYLEQMTGMQMLVDWRALYQAGWTRDSLARLEVTDAPLSQALQSLLGPMELSFRVLDADTLQITTARAALETLEIEFFPVADLVARDQGQKLLEGIRSILGESGVGSRSSADVRLDGTSQTIMVSAPQYKLAAVARLIEQLTADPHTASVENF
jgi:hypothetical protein